MPTGQDGPHEDENLLFWHERMVCAMRAARGRPTSGPPKSADNFSGRMEFMFGSHGSLGKKDNEVHGLLVPEPCWERIRKHIKAIATCAGLVVKSGRRYVDPAGVVYVVFVRRELDEGV